MISRRSIRTKSFQVIYSQVFNDTETGGSPEALDFFGKSIEKVYFTYFFNVALAIKSITKLKEKGQLAAAEVPTLAEFKALLAKSAKLPNSNKMIVRAMVDYSNQFVEQEKVMEEYLEHEFPKMVEQNCETTAAFYKWIQTSADYNELFADQMINGAGSDDYSIITGTMRKTIKAFPAFTELENTINSDDDTTIEFGNVLISSFFKDEKMYDGLLETQSRNWEIDRVAMIDKILIKMAIAEMCCFPSIPVNVSINEYIEVSKIFSLDKSKEFINGILDKVGKKLVEEGKITKDHAPEGEKK
jgi:transcription antitermination protein NusB